MRLAAVLALTLLCAGCATQQSYVAWPVDISNGPAYSSDVKYCHHLASLKRPGATLLSVGKISSAGTEAALNSAPTAAISPTAVGLAAVGASGAEALDEIGLTSQNEIRSYVICLREKTNRDRSALVADPNG